VGDIEINPHDFASNLDPEQRIAKCLACHGENAGGDADFGPDTHFGTPALRGMREVYLRESLTAYQAGTRAHDEMSVVATMLDEETTRFMALTFAAFDAPSPLSADELAALASKDSLFREGQTIALSGIPEQGVPACAACHGDLGEGTEIGPRLAGQNAMYIESQFKAFGSRQTVRAAQMHPAVAGMTAPDIKAVAHYYELMCGPPNASSSPRSR
jgi:cytochrome c553